MASIDAPASDHAGAGTRALSFSVVDTIGAVAQPEWDALAAGHAGASHGWLRAVEDTMPAHAEPRHVLVRDGRRLVGAAIGYVCRQPGTSLDPDMLLLGRLARPARRLGLSFRPALVSTTPRNYGRQVLGDTGAVLQALEATARSERLPLHLPRVAGERSVLAQALRARAYLETEQDPVARLDIAWPSFEAYVASLKRRRRKLPTVVRHEIRKAREDGVRMVEIAEPAAHAGRLHELADQHQRRLNGTPSPFPAGFVPRLKELMGGGCTVYGAFAGSRLVGFIVMVRAGEEASLPVLGIEAGHRASFVYFNLVFYRPIADAIELGLRRIWFGPLLLEPKVRRGCRVVRAAMFYRAPTRIGHEALRPWFALHRRWCRERRFAAALALAKENAR